MARSLKQPGVHLTVIKCYRKVRIPRFQYYFLLKIVKHTYISCIGCGVQVLRVTVRLAESITVMKCYRNVRIPILQYYFLLKIAKHTYVSCVGCGVQVWRVTVRLAEIITPYL